MNEITEELGQKLELNYVRNTYDNIADGFSSTRYKKWPKVDEFLKNLPKGSLLLDIGCGNGKYLDNSSTLNIGCDVSSNLLSICKTKGFEVVHCDMMRLPFRNNHFDAIICIAALHHIVTVQRRQQCLQGIVDLLSSNEQSRLLVQVWSYEQELDKDNPYLSKKHKSFQDKQNDRNEGEVEPRKEVIVDKELKMPIHKNRTPFTDQDLLVPFKTNLNQTTSEDRDDEQLRYYHVFKEGELDSMIGQLQNVQLLESYYDKGNWCAIVTKK